MLCVVSWNPGPSFSAAHETNASWVAQLLQHRPDVIVLQECKDSIVAQLNAHSLASTAARTYYEAAGGTIEVRFATVFADVCAEHVAAARVYKVLVQAATGQPVAIYGAHLPANRSGGKKARKLVLDTAIADIDKCVGVPHVIFGGDLNLCADAGSEMRECRVRGILHVPVDPEHGDPAMPDSRSSFCDFFYAKGFEDGASQFLAWDVEKFSTWETARKKKKSARSGVHYPLLWRAELRLKDENKDDHDHDEAEAHEHKEQKHESRAEEGKHEHKDEKDDKVDDEEKKREAAPGLAAGAVAELGVAALAAGARAPVPPAAPVTVPGATAVTAPG